MRFFSWLALAIAAFVGFSSPGNAQATRTWVSGVGSDSNACSRTAPCRTFTGAIAKTAVGGEINVLDPGDYQPVKITKAITIRADHVEAAIQAFGGQSAITVAAGNSDTVVLEGLDIDGQQIGGSPQYGVIVESGSLVYVLRCAVHGFNTGVYAQSSTSGARLFVRDSVISGNSTGVAVVGSSDAVAVSNTLIDGNQSTALDVENQQSAALVGSILSGSPAGIVRQYQLGTVNSIGPSNVITGTGAPTATTPYR